MLKRVRGWLRNSLCWALALLAGCANINDWGLDTPRIRELQEESLVGLAPMPIAGQSIEDFFRDRVGLVETGKKQLPNGRAVPVSSDGYFLTAWHVVDAGEFFLSDFVSLQPLPEGVAFEAKDYYRVDRHKGRVVWRDEKLDLALVAFDFRVDLPFRLAGSRSANGAQVFSAAVGSNSGAVFVSDDFSDGSGTGVGNGPYLTAGTILKSSLAKREGGLTYHSTLVARGGMSGGAVVDASGDLVGIITEIRPSIGSAPRTSFAMLGAAQIEVLVREDRALR